MMYDARRCRLLSLVGIIFNVFEKVKMRFLKPSLLLLLFWSTLFSTAAFAQGAPQKGVQVGDIDTKTDPFIARVRCHEALIA